MTCGTKRGRRPTKSSIIPKFGEDGDFFVIPSDFEQTFRVTVDDEILRGVYHDFTQRSLVYLRGHECIEDIINTCNHEALHHCFAGVFYGSDRDNPIDMDVYQEHWAIKMVAWAQDIDFDKPNSVIREDVGDTNDWR